MGSQAARAGEKFDLATKTPKILSKKIKATYFKGYPGPYYLIGKNKFEFNPDR